MGRLDVRIVEGRNLVACELVSNPDPYVIVCVEGDKKQTKVCDGTVNPKWDQVLNFMVRDHNSSQLMLEVWNKNPIKDDFMGRYNLSLSGLEQGVVMDTWVQLQQVKQGEVHVRVLAVDFGKIPSTPQPAPGQVPVVQQVVQPAQPQVVYVQQPAPQPQVVYVQQPPAPGYGAPPPQYGAPPPQYGAPPPQYGAPPPQY
eukprot:PhF_6_TR19106/c1_g1_i2/m.28110